MTIVRKQVTTRTFDSGTGTLIEAGGFITIDTSENPLVKPKTEDGVVNPGNHPNLRDPSAAPVIMPIVVAPIAPTGPNPTQPQQIPPGAVQTHDGYTMNGAALIAEGSVEAVALENGEDPVVEEGGKPIESTSKRTSKSALS